MEAPQILCIEGRDSFAYHFASSKDCFHAENSIKTEFHCNSLSKSTNKPELRRDWGTRQGIYGDRKEETRLQSDWVLFMPHFLICSSSILIYFLGCYFPPISPRIPGYQEKKSPRHRAPAPFSMVMNREGVCEHPRENLLLQGAGS